MKYGLRALVGTADGIWIDTASENSDGGASAGCASANGSCGAPAGGAAATASPNGLSGVAPAVAPPAAAAGVSCSSSSGGTISDGLFFPVFSALLSCH